MIRRGAGFGFVFLLFSVNFSHSHFSSTGGVEDLKNSLYNISFSFYVHLFIETTLQYACFFFSLLILEVAFKFPDLVWSLSNIYVK